MVKFGKELKAQLVQEWRSAYVDYKQLKRDIKAVRRAMKNSPPVPDEWRKTPMSTTSTPKIWDPHRGSSIAKPRHEFNSVTHQISRSVSRVHESVVSVTDRAADKLWSRPRSKKHRTKEEFLKVRRIDPDVEGQYEVYTTELSEAFGDIFSDSVALPTRVFFHRLDAEFNKVNQFYRKKEEEFLRQYETLKRQVQALEEIRVILRRGISRVHYVQPAADSDSDSRRPETVAEAVDFATVTQFAASRRQGGVEAEIEMASRGSANETNGNSNKPQLRLKIPLNSPAATIKSLTQSLWEDLLKQGGQDTDSSSSITVTKKNVRIAEKMLRKAFEEFYRGLGLLKNYWFISAPNRPFISSIFKSLLTALDFIYFWDPCKAYFRCPRKMTALSLNFSSLNVIAFAKTLKKFDKATGYHTLPVYLKAVELSHFGTSNATIILLEKVEALFAKTFSKDDQSKARTLLRPVKTKASHAVTFLLGLFTGGSIALFTVLVTLMDAKLGQYISEIDPSTEELEDAEQENIYLKTIFPIFGLSALIIIHMFMYGFNCYYWCKWRINYAFMFDMKPGTEVRHREVLMVAVVLLTILIAAMVGQLSLHGATDSPYVDIIPLAYFLLLMGLLFLPFNTLKRSSRVFFITTLIHVILVPFYKVLLKDSFLGDQLTSQVPMLRFLLYGICYYSGGFFKENDADKCFGNKTFRGFLYLVSILPYWWRFLQCIRRYVEDHDIDQIYNACKHLSTAVAMGLRIQYLKDKARRQYVEDWTNLWFVLHIVASVITTVYQTYWDVCVDWGLLHMHSKNKWLRDDLIMPDAKHWYFLSMIANIVLRVAWVQAIVGFRFRLRDGVVADFTFACLEIIRRGIWNFYRLENEHLNNVGKYRATKTIPLPFERLDDL